VAFHAEPSAGPPGAFFSPYSVVPPGTPKAKRQRQTLGTITDGPPGEYITDRLTDEALRFVAADPSKPFFLNLWHYGVHGPWGHKEAYTAEFAKKKDPRGLQGNPVMGSMLKSVDESLGRILTKLDELGIAENTILIFTSDNGGNIHSMTEDDAKASRSDAANPTVASYRRWAGFQPPTNNAPLRDGKGRLYEGGVRVPLMVRWPGKIAPGTTNDTVVGCVDVYPTVLDLLGLSPSPSQKIDGVSYASVLRGTGPLTRDAYFIWFPHLVPGVSVRQGDWKLIRRFEERPSDYAGLHELFNLREDPSETKNLAAEQPDKVKALNALIDAFVAETGALYPKPNPAYQPRAAVDPAQGLVPKFCKATVIDGALRVEAAGRTPFLGTASVRLTGPHTLNLRARSTSGGPARVQWKTADQTDFPAEGQTVDFSIPGGGEWQNLTVPVPVAGQPSIVRLYLPASSGPVDLEKIQFSSASGKPIQWLFAPKPTP
jgi:hypothetical protein